MHRRLALFAMAGAPAAWAHGPSRLKVQQSITVNAPPEAVWARVKDFAAMHQWHPAVQATRATDGNNVGSIRTLTLKGGGQVGEELEEHNEALRRMTYRMKVYGPIPVSNYVSTMQVKAGDAAGTTLLEWRGAFYRGYPNNDPPPAQNDDAAVAAVTGIYQAGLASLKAQVEGR